MLSWTLLFYVSAIGAIAVLATELVSEASKLRTAYRAKHASTPAEWVARPRPAEFRPVRQHEFRGVNADGLACYDEVIVDACYLSDRP